VCREGERSVGQERIKDRRRKNVSGSEYCPSSQIREYYIGDEDKPTKTRRIAY